MPNTNLDPAFSGGINPVRPDVPEPRVTVTICDRCGGEAGTDHESGLDICDECGVVESHTHLEDEEGNTVERD